MLAINNLVGLGFAEPVAGALVLDSITATVVGAYGLRKLRAAYAGAAVSMRSTINGVADIGFSGNDFDTAAAATHIGGGSGFIATFYDQTGNGNHLVQATIASQPEYSATGLNGHPTLVFDDTDDFLDKTSLAFTSGAQAAFSVVLKFAAGADDNDRVFSYVADGDATDFGVNTSSAVMFLNAGTLTSYRNGFGDASAISLDTPVTSLAHYDGTTNLMYVNNIPGSGVADTRVFATPGTLRIGDTAHAAPTAPLGGSISEAIVFTGVLSSGDRIIIHNSQSSYWL